MVRARVATKTTKNGLRIGPNSANEAKQLGSDRTPYNSPPNKHKNKNTGSVRDMLGGGGNTPPKR